MKALRSEADLVERAAKAQPLNWSAAAKLTAELRKRFPDSQAGYQIGASAARALRLFDEATAILAEASHRFADQSWVAAEQLALAHARGDAEQARRLATDLRNRFPQHGSGYHIGAAAARDLRLFDEASAILTEAVSRFADQSWVATEQVALAQARGDAQQARRLAADLRNRFPQQGSGYHIGAAAARELRLFDEASAILSKAVGRFADQSWVAAEQAALAQARGDAQQARRLAADLRNRFPQLGTGYQIGAAAARELRLFDEASAILKEPVGRFADQAWVAAEQAALAQARGDAQQARRLAADLRNRFPQQGSGYHIGAAAARELRLFDEATAILTEAVSRFADQSWVATEQLSLAQARGDAEQARRLAADLRSRFPQHEPGYHLGAAAARDLRLFDEASTILSEAGDRFADQSWVASEQAWLAHARGDAEQARQLAADLRNRFPQHGPGYQIGAAAARDLRLFDEASAILAEAGDRFADQSWVASEQAWLAHARGDAEDAIQLMAALRSREPANPTGYRTAVSLLRGLNRVAESQVILEEARPRFSSEAWFVRQSAEISKLSNLVVNRADAERLIRILTAEGRDLRFLARDQCLAFGKLVVVVGMHRAGTSLCTKIVSLLGFSLGGPLLGPRFDNPDGHQEHEEIFQSHQALLSHLGAAWDTSWSVRPPVEQHLQSAEVRQILDRLKSVVVRELRASGGRWAFKDPRTACLLPAWTCIFEELGIEPLWLLAVRDPRAVAASLYARNRLAPAVGELLWVEHYLNALRYLGPRIAGIIHYEKWFSPEHEQLDALANILGAVSLSEIERASASINHSLRHDTAQPGEAMLGVTRDVYSWLCSDCLPLGILQERAELVWRGLRERSGRGLECESAGTATSRGNGVVALAERPQD